MGSIRPAAVAGIFYPGSARELEEAVAHHLSQADADEGPVPKAVIAPHAGYVYSGAVAAKAYARLKPARDRIKRVVLLGPCHRVAVRGLAASSADAFATPLGNVPVDKEALARIRHLPQVKIFDATHAQEHSLEVHLPFLQRILDDFTVVPLVVGDASAEEVAQVLEVLWGGPETVILVSSDLSHYHPYAEAREMDAATCRAIESLDPQVIGDEQACGRIPMRGLLTLARRKEMRVSTVDLRNSGDTAGSKDRVVGYGSWVFVEPQMAAKGPKAAGESEDFAAKTHRLLAQHGDTLLRTAADSILHGIDHGSPISTDSSNVAADLMAPGACFVTLRRNEDLRGCIGSPTAHRPLIVDAAENGFAAAFHDPRFPKLRSDEITGLSLSLSVLSIPSPLKVRDEPDLLNQLRPGVDGLIIVDGSHRALFLPSVWKSLADPGAFLAHLKRKAGLRAEHWSPTFRASRFIAAELSSESLSDPQSIWTSTARH